MSQPIQPSDEPETSPRLAKSPPIPPAPPTTGMTDGFASGGRSGGGRMFAIGFGKVLTLNALMIVAGAWLVSLPGIIGALALSVPLALIGARELIIRKPILFGFVASFIGGVLGSVVFGAGSALTRVVLGLATGFLVAPSVFPILMMRWSRVHYPRASA